MMKGFSTTLWIAAVLTSQPTAQPTPEFIAARLFVGQVYPSGNAYLKSLAGEHAGGNLPKSVFLLPLSGDSVVLRTPPAEAALTSATVNFDWTRTDDVMRKIQEEVDELREVVGAPGPVDRARAEDEMGDLLFSIANLSRKLGIEPETALRKANDKFSRRFTEMEQSIAASGRSMTQMELDDLEAEWQRAKSAERA